ncbi:peptidase M24, structural domain-containing protein [Mycena floridula]|nr:peptidase M24, structural domain-containing protein [Mycena floridula]
MLDKKESLNKPFQKDATKPISRTGVLLALVFWFCVFRALHGPVAWFDVSQPSFKDHCAKLPSISKNEFLARQTALAKTLHSLGAAAYIAEPGADAKFYGNISWSLSERPLLLIISPLVSGDDIEAKVTLLTPRFEATRAKMIQIPSSNGVEYIEWAEEANPYQVAASAFSDNVGTVFVDQSIRHFIFDGLQNLAILNPITSAPTDIVILRERKSAAELELLKCANEATLLAIRDVHKRMFIGMRESEARSMMSEALTEAGLKDGGCLTLFGENAALPHGSGSDRVLGRTDFALFDCTASLHNYQSDVTRTVALPSSDIPLDHLKIWHSVHSAQTAALETAGKGIIAYQVDQAARNLLKTKGYGDYFTHRLGHGIGLSVHESPYLNGGSQDIIDVGHTFSNEPGVYIEEKVGVRLEDCFYVDTDGTARYLTAQVGGQAQSPWAP